MEPVVLFPGFHLIHSWSNPCSMSQGWVESYCSTRVIEHGSEQDHWRQASNAEYISDMGGHRLWICSLHFAVLVANVSSWADLVVGHPLLSHCCMHQLEPPILSWEAVGLVSSEQLLWRFSVWSPAQNLRVCLISSYSYEFTPISELQITIPQYFSLNFPRSLSPLSWKIQVILLGFNGQNHHEGGLAISNWLAYPSWESIKVVGSVWVDLFI